MVYAGPMARVPLKATWMVKVLFPEGAPPAQTQGKPRWQPLWNSDCAKLEAACTNKGSIVPVSGGEYEVDVDKRVMRPVYWHEKPAEREVVRGTWFYKSSQGHWYPYSELDAMALEELYQRAPALLEVRQLQVLCSRRHDACSTRFAFA